MGEELETDWVLAVVNICELGKKVYYQSCHAMLHVVVASLQTWFLGSVRSAVYLYFGSLHGEHLIFRGDRDISHRRPLPPSFPSPFFLSIGPGCPSNKVPFCLQVPGLFLDTFASCVVT